MWNVRFCSKGGNRDSAMGWEIRGSITDSNNIFFSSPVLPDQLWGPTSPLLNRYPGSFPGIKRPDLEVHHIFLPSVEVKSERSCHLHMLPLHNCVGDPCRIISVLSV